MSDVSTAFASLPLPPSLMEGVTLMGFAAMTPVQAHALPPILQRRDVIAQARTGSGKTVAFGLGLLARVDVNLARVQGLVLCPTRELADQVSTEIRRLARCIPNLRVVTLCGGVPVRMQTPSLQTPPHVIVGTPGRILDHLERETIEVGGLEVLVLDEADRMLDMGFLEGIETVVAQTPKSRQTLLFSATYPSTIRTLSKGVQSKPVEVTVDSEAPAAAVDERLYAVAQGDKLAALSSLLSAEQPESSLVFCHTRNDVRSVTAALSQQGFSVLALHGELEQFERDDVLLRFANKSCAVLVATDVAARGLDIKNLSAVISWELPTDADTHVHRIGRTARAGAVGAAWALVSPSERDRVAMIEAHTGRAFTEAALPVSAPTEPPVPAMVTLVIDGGKQDKLRAGDILGALTQDLGVPGAAIGKIDVLPRFTYVAVARAHAATAERGLRTARIKGKTFRLRSPR